MDQQQFPVLLEAAKSLRIRGLYEETEDTFVDEEASKEQRQTVGINNHSVSELSVTTNEAATKIKIEDLKSAGVRKRSHSEESEEEPIQSPESVRAEDDISVEETPTKMFKPMYGPLQGVSNPFWLMSQDLKGSENTAESAASGSPPDVPNLMNLVSQASLLQTDSGKQSSKIQNAQKINEHFLQAMQMCTNPYLSTVAAMQKPLDLLSSTNFSPNFPQGLSPSSTKSSPNSKSMISTAPVRRYKQYSEDSLQAALKEIMNGQSISKSSMNHNIPRRTLWNRVKRQNGKQRISSQDATDSEGRTSPKTHMSAFKYRRMRDLNNEASWRCRENRKLRLGSVEADLRRQTERNLQLKAAVCALETRVARLKHVRNQIASARRGLGPSLRIIPDFIGSFAHSSVGDSHQHMRGPIPGLPKLTYHGPRPYH